eukprot:CFRG2611T1
MTNSSVIWAAQSTMSVLSKLNVAPALPSPTGNFTVSHTDVEAYVQSGTRVFMRIYYPSESEGSASPWLPHYDYGAGYGDLLKLPRWLSGYVVSSVVGHVNIPGGIEGKVRDPPAGSDQWPLVVFSHGLATWRSHYSAVCSDLASRGVIVACIEHRDGSAIASVAVDDENENVDYEKLDKLINKDLRVEDRMQEIMIHRRRQMQTRIKESIATLDILEMIQKGILEPVSGNPTTLKAMRGIIDVDNVSIGGHSFGGGTCVAAASLDTRFKRVIALDPWLDPVPSEAFDVKPTAKTLVISAGLGSLSSSEYWTRNLGKIERMASAVGRITSADNVDRTKRLIDARVLWVSMKGATHVDFSDAAFFVPQWLYSMYSYIDIHRAGLNPIVIMERVNTATYAYITADIEKSSCKGKNVYVDEIFRDECNESLNSYVQQDVGLRPTDVTLVLAAYD